MNPDELAGWLRLTLCVGNASARKLLQAFGLPEAIFQQSADTLRQVLGSQKVAQLLQEPAQLPGLLQTTQNWLAGGGTGALQRRVLSLGDPGYPAGLLSLADPPLLLYLAGAGEFSEKPPPAQEGKASSALDFEAKYAISSNRCLAIVGSRNPTPQGIRHARDFSRSLGQAGFCIISGLALGIDGAAHEGALLGNASTVAVVGTGLDRVYPKAHHALAHQITENGLLLSEYPLGTPPLSANFPRRNRLIAALARGTLVIEAALQSGSLITARLAAEQGKEVFAIPGSIIAAQSRGCHALIKQGAKLVETVQDVLDEFADFKTPSEAPDWIAADAFAASPKGTLDKQQGVLDALGFDPLGLDALQARCGLDTAQLQVLLLELELQGQVARLGGGLFQRQR